MPTLTYPSPLTPAPPQIRLDVPDGWEQLEVPQALLAAREAEVASGQFASNVTVQHVARPASLTETDLLEEVREYVGGKDHGAVGDTFARTVNGTEVHGVALSYVDPTAGPLGQVHAFARHVDGPRASVVQVIVTFSGDESVALLPAIRAIVDSLQISWPMPGALV